MVQNMTPEYIINGITSLLAKIYTEIELLNKSGLTDKNIFAENLMRQLFNAIFGYQLVNANTKSGKSNYPGIDLIDEDNKVVCQVSSETSKKKIEETISRVQDNKSLHDFHLLYIALTNDPKNLPKYKCQDGLTFTFNPSEDVYDGHRLIMQIENLDILKQIALYDTLSLWLGTRSWEEIDVRHLLEQTYSLKTFELPEFYIPRFFEYSINNDTNDFVERIIHPYKFMSGSLADFVCGKIQNVTTNKFIIYSSAQNGKTTELYKLANELSTEGKYCVTYIEASDYNNYKGEHFLKTCLSCYEQDAVYLIDALDEVADSKRSTLIKEIRRFADANPLAKFVITFRKNYENKDDLCDFSRLSLMSLSEKDIHSYAEFHLNSENDFYEQAQKKRIEHLLYTPFFLMNLVKYYKKHDGLVSKIVDIYEYVVQESYNVDNEEGIVNTDKYEIENKLERIALTLQFSEEQSIKGYDLEKYLGFSKSDISNCLRYTVLEKNGDDFSFTHNGIKEYFVTRYLLNRDYEEIVKLVCYDQGRIHKIRKNWYNVVMFLLSSLDVTNCRFQKLLHLVMENDIEILADIDPMSISDDIKYEVLRSVLNSYKEKDIYPSDDNTYRGLTHLCDNADASRFLLSELEKIAKLSPYTYLLEQIIRNADFGALILANLDKTFEKTIFSKIRELGANDTHDTYVLYEPFANKYFGNKRTINRLRKLNVNSIDKMRVRTIFRLIATTKTSDDYVDFIIEEQSNVHGYRMNGFSHMVSRDYVYKSITGIKSYQGLKKIWGFIPSFIGEEIHNDEDNVQDIITSLLLNSKAVMSKHGDLLCDIEKCWYSIYDEHVFSLNRIKGLFNLFREFSLQFRGQVNILSRVKKVKEKFKEIPHEDLESFQACLGLYAYPCDAEEIFKFLDSRNEYDYYFATWLNTNILPEWDSAIRVLTKKTFPQFKQYPTQEEQRMKELQAIFNYNQFKTEIMSIIENYASKNRKELQQKIKESEELKWSNDVACFMQMSYECKSGKYDLNKAKQFIQDKEVYESFLLNRITHRDKKCLTITNKNSIRKLLNKQLGKKELESTMVKNYLRLAMDLEIPLNKTIIKNYICYAACKKTEHSYIGDDGCFLQYADQYIDEKVLIEVAKRVIRRECANHAEDCLILAKYLIDKHEKNSYKDILELMLRDDFPYYFQISEHFAKLGRTGQEHLKSIYDSANVELRLVIIGQLYKESIHHPWIKLVLERDKELFEKDHKETILRYGLAFGKDSALTETLEIMKKNNLYFGNFSSAPKLGYSDIKYLPQLEQLLKISFIMEEKYTNWSGVIIDAMKNIAIHSEEDMKTVCELLSKYTTTEKWLNRSIINIQSVYYEKHDEKMTIKTAARLALS